MRLDRYVSAFEEADIAALARLMRDDIALEMPPLAQWFRGRAAVADFFPRNVLREPGRFRMAPTTANGEPAFVAHLPGDRPHAVHVLTLTAASLAHIAVFLNAAVSSHFMNASQPTVC